MATITRTFGLFDCFDSRIPDKAASCLKGTFCPCFQCADAWATGRAYLGKEDDQWNLAFGAWWAAALVGIVPCTQCALTRELYGGLTFTDMLSSVCCHPCMVCMNYNNVQAELQGGSPMVADKVVLLTKDITTQPSGLE